MEFGLMQVTDRLELSTSSVRVGPRPGLSLDTAMEFGIQKSHALVPRQMDSIMEYGLKNWQTGQLADSTTK